MVPEPATWPAEVGPPGRRPDHIMVPEPATWPAEVGPPGRRPDQIMVPEPATWPAEVGPLRPQAGPNHGRPVG